MNEDNEIQALCAGEALLNQVAFDLEPALYVVTAAPSTATGRPEDYEQAVLEVMGGSSMMRNSYLLLDRLYQASIDLEGGYVFLARLKDTRKNVVTDVRAWHILAGELIPMDADPAYRAVCAVIGRWYVKKDFVRGAWKPETST